MLRAIRQLIETDMARFEEMRASVLSSPNPLLGLALAHVASRQGKMMRPMLALLMGKACHEQLDDEIMHAALALELLHTASLVHDDVVDESDRRRGKASVNALFDNQAAVLVGDYILSLALAEAARTGSTHFVEAIAQLGQDLADGELLQLHNMDLEEIAEEQYFDVIRRKTATLFATCCAATYILHGEGASKGSLKQAHRLGDLIGIIFQMRDDIIDIVATDMAEKPAGNDLREGKLTLPVIHAITIDPSLTAAALRVRRREASADDICSLTTAAVAHGIDYANARMETLIAEAHTIADNICTENIATALHTYIDYVVQREK